jgi:hypothetical protein
VNHVRKAWRAALLLLVVTACGFGSDQVTGRIGQTISAGDYQLTVSHMDNPAERPDRFTNPKPGNRFVRFDVVVADQGSQHLPVAAGHFTLQDSGGIDNPAMPGIPTDTGLRQTSLAPGQTLQTVLFFEMAANLQPTQLVFAPAVVGWRTRITVDLQ